jgi:hypothetical protein
MDFSSVLATAAVNIDKSKSNIDYCQVDYLGAGPHSTPLASSSGKFS